MGSVRGGEPDGWGDEEAEPDPRQGTADEGRQPGEIVRWRPGELDRRRRHDLERRRNGDIEPRRRGDVERGDPTQAWRHLGSAASTAPSPLAGEPFDFGGGTSPGRDVCWEMLPDGVRTRLLERAGEVITWWSDTYTDLNDGRPSATVLGESGLWFAEPAITTEHRPVYALRGYVYEPGGLRKVTIDHRPPPAPPPEQASRAGAVASRPDSAVAPPRTAGGPVNRPTPTSPPAPSRPPGSAPPVTQSPDIGLSRAACGVLGNLPHQAQVLLQSPFSGAYPVRHCHWNYYGSPRALNEFAIYLSGTRYVTFATGTRVIPVGHDEASAHWDLQCARADVVRRVGL